MLQLPAHGDVVDHPEHRARAPGDRIGCHVAPFSLAAATARPGIFRPAARAHRQFRVTRDTVARVGGQAVELIARLVVTRHLRGEELGGRLFDAAEEIVECLVGENRPALRIDDLSWLRYRAEDVALQGVGAPKPAHRDQSGGNRDRGDRQGGENYHLEPIDRRGRR